MLSRLARTRLRFGGALHRLPNLTWSASSIPPQAISASCLTLRHLSSASPQDDSAPSDDKKDTRVWRSWVEERLQNLSDQSSAAQERMATDEAADSAAGPPVSAAAGEASEGQLEGTSTPGSAADAATGPLSTMPSQTAAERKPRAQGIPADVAPLPRSHKVRVRQSAPSEMETASALPPGREGEDVGGAAEVAAELESPVDVEEMLESSEARPSGEQMDTATTTWNNFFEDEARKSQATASVESDQPDVDTNEYRARDLARQWRRPGLDGPSLASPDSGFAQLGEGEAVADGPRSAPGPPGMEHSTSQLLSFRTFWPGQSYTPDDLNPYTPRPAQRMQSNMMQKTSNAEVMAQADYRNVPFLARFITPTGQLTPRRRTKLQQKVHRHVCRQIKLAKIMALIPTDRVPTPPPRQRSRGIQDRSSNNASRNGASAPEGPPSSMRFAVPPTMQVSAHFLAGTPPDSDVGADGSVDV